MYFFVVTPVLYCCQIYTSHIITRANIQTNSLIHTTSLNEKNSLTLPIDVISHDSENESALIEHSKCLNVYCRLVVHILSHER